MHPHMHHNCYLLKHMVRTVHDGACTEREGNLTIHTIYSKKVITLLQLILGV